MEVVTNTQIADLPLVAQDEVRDMYQLSQQKKLIVYTDRMHVNGELLEFPIPYRGAILNQISLYWKNKFTHLIGHNLIAQQVTKFPDNLQPYSKILNGRSVIVQELRELPLYFKVIGNLVGDEWDMYKKTQRINGRLLPKGIREGHRLENAVVTAYPGEALRKQPIDDINKWAQRMFGPMLFKTIEDACLSIYGVARNYAAARGVIIADAMFEFGLHEGTPYIINEVMTPESSTFWSGENFVPSEKQPSLDKQPLLDWYAQRNKADGQSAVPQDVIKEVSKRHHAIYQLMTGKVPAPSAETA